MKAKVPKIVESCRVKKGPMGSNKTYGFNGVFVIPYKRYELTVIVSDKLGWDHVSVSLKDRVPTWYEMKYVKELFFDDDEIVVQFHPPKEKYVNFHSNVLHMWKKQGAVYELPRIEFV